MQVGSVYSKYLGVHFLLLVAAGAGGSRCCHVHYCHLLHLCQAVPQCCGHLDGMDDTNSLQFQFHLHRRRKQGARGAVAPLDF